jgi:DNA-binding NarL/FixJ family response regulator
LELLAREGLSDKEIGDRRHTSPKTVEYQLAEVRRKFEVAAGIENVDRQLLIAEFSPYFLLNDSLGDLLSAERP